MVEVLHGHGKFIDTETQGKAFVYLSNRALIKVLARVIGLTSMLSRWIGLKPG